MSSTFPTLSAGAKIALAVAALGFIIAVLAAIGLMDKFAAPEEPMPAVVPATE